MNNIKIYTDGGCSKNGAKINFGGIGAVILIPGKKIITLHKGYRNTTNQKMELSAAIEALKRVDKEPESETLKIELLSDSKYLVNCFKNKWYKNWNKNGWRTRDNKLVKNQALWKELIDLGRNLNVKFKWIPGHQGNKHNEKADQLARLGMQEVKSNYKP